MKMHQIYTIQCGQVCVVKCQLWMERGDGLNQQLTCDCSHLCVITGSLLTYVCFPVSRHYEPEPSQKKPIAIWI